MEGGLLFLCPGYGIPVSYTHLDVYKRQELYNYHKKRQGIGMENQFIRHEPCFERILFVLTLDRKKMKERILIGEEQQIRFRLNVYIKIF